MRIKYTRPQILTKENIDNKYIIIFRKNNTNIPYNFYCGKYNYNTNCLYDCVYNNDDFTKILDFCYGIYFGHNYLNQIISDVYIISEEDYKRFKQCIKPKQIKILLDNLYGIQ